MEFLENKTAQLYLSIKKSGTVITGLPTVFESLKRISRLNHSAKNACVLSRPQSNYRADSFCILCLILKSDLHILRKKDRHSKQQSIRLSGYLKIFFFENHCEFPNNRVIKILLITKNMFNNIFVTYLLMFLPSTLYPK